MPRVLPNGLDVRVMPVTPDVGDPKDYVFDTTSALQSAQAGLTLGQELVRIQDTGKQIELERAKRAADLAEAKASIERLKHAELLRNAEAETLQSKTAAAIAQFEAQRKQANLQGASAQSLFDSRIPELQTGLLSKTLANETATANANAMSGFAGMSAPQQTQALAAAQAVGGWGVPSGGLNDVGGTPYPFRRTDTVESIDPTTGNTIQEDVVRDTRNGAIISRGERRVQKLGVDEKSTTAAAREATSLVQTIDMANKLSVSLDEYAKSGKGGLVQAMATSAANAPSNGPISVIKKAAGAAAQNPETTAIATEIQALKNNLGNAMFGSALSKNETENLNGMLPTVEDLADPVRAKAKLEQTKNFLQTKLRPYEERGILSKMKMAPQGEPTSAQTPAAALQPAATQATPQEGEIRNIRVRGQWIKAQWVKDPVSGKWGYRPV